MWFTKQIVLGLCLALLMVCGGGCHRPLPAPAPGVTLLPGRYLEGSYRAPGFAPGEAAYELQAFTVEEIRGLDRDTFLDLLQTDLAQAFEANGLKLKSGTGVCRVSGSVRRMTMQGALLRSLLGTISVHLEVSGAITREGQTLFAFSDRVRITSPVNLGPPAPKERELLVQQALRAFFHHLLTEMLFYRASEPAG